jgi:hypothetical protein
MQRRAPLFMTLSVSGKDVNGDGCVSDAHKMQALVAGKIYFARNSPSW